MTDFHQSGWQVFAHHPATAAWAVKARAVAQGITGDPAMRAQWLQCEGTWFVGVDALPNDTTGALEGVPLDGAFREALSPMPPLHPAQLSVIYPGYPRPRAGESTAAFRYRQNRDAAHVDGLLRDTQGRRHLLEPHAFVLGLPLTACTPDASPLVVWQGSHLIMQTAFRGALAGHRPETWHKVDLTDVYQATRRHVFDTCPRVAVTAQPGEAILLHRLVLHGMAPWQAGASAPEDGRMIAYFRPLVESGVANWLD